MPSILSKNCIVAGAIDFYCLLCATPFRTEEEAITHIGESHHKARLSSTGYYEKYEDDRIKKIKSVYFCEWCNTTLPTAIKVKLHVGEDNHIEKKTIDKITRVSNNIIASGSTVIHEDSWNGIIEENCVICSVEVDNKFTHNSSQSHVLNLIRSEVLFEKLGTVYREVDAGFYQCLNCNIMLSQHELTQHFQTFQHTDLVLESSTKLSCKNGTIKQADSTNKTENIKEKTMENGKDTETVDVKKGQTKSLPLPTGMKTDGTNKTTLFTTPVLRNHKSQATRTAPDTSTNKLETFAKTHGLSPNRADNSFYCKTCSRRIPATFHDLETHVNSKSHQEKASSKACNFEMLLTEPKKVPIEEFITEMACFEHGDVEFILINNSFVITTFSFALIYNFNKKYICLACHIDLVQEKVPEHLLSMAHEESIKKCLVITSIKDEFIRQINNENYLCGYCGILQKDWDDMLDHLQSEQHRIAKAEAEKLKHKNAPEVIAKNDRNTGETVVEFNSAAMYERFKMFEFLRQHHML